MKMSIRVAGAQIPVTKDIDENLRTVLRAIEGAAREKADILLTPEGSLSGYSHTFDRPAAAEAVEKVRAAAREAGLALALGTCFAEPENGRPFNEIRFYEKDGSFLGFHGKTLRCGSMGDPPRGEIEHYAAAPLRTFAVGDVTVGGLICNDLWANPLCTPMPDPHLTQELANRGARIIFHAVNGGRSRASSAWFVHSVRICVIYHPHGE